MPVFLLYHFFHPDDVVSARLYSDLAVELTQSGYEVTAFPSTRRCHGSAVRLAKRESWAGGKIRRVWRPDWDQQRTLGRFGNTLFMLIGWAWLALVTPRRRGEIMIVGTDPVLGVLATIPWRILRPRSRIIHWCHDVYPDAAIADGMIDGRAWWVRLIQWILGIAYRRCDTIADLGICMRRLLQTSRGDAIEDADEADNLTATTTRWRSGPYATVVPWSLVEPPSVVDPDAAVRQELFGDSRLGLLYSGNFGRAHSYETLLELARRLRGQRIGFCFAGRGMRMDEIRSEVTAADDNIRFAGFADESQLSLRLAAADVHLVSLRPTWTGTVVPSKFFGALAAGRPVLFAGDSRSAIARWITRHEIGWVLTDDTIDAVAAGIPLLADDPSSVVAMRQRCFDVYQREFSRSVQMRRWKSLLEDAAGE